MKLTKRQKDIIKKIWSEEIKDIPSFLNTYNLYTFKQLNKEEITKRMKTEENGRTYKKLKENVQIISFTSNQTNFGMFPSAKIIPPKENDFEYVPADISYNSSSTTITTSNSQSFKFDYFEGINITNSFDDIKDFLTIWQFLKSENLILEVDKEVTKEDYAPFFEFIPISETEFGKKKNKQKNKLKMVRDTINNYNIPKETEADQSSFLRMVNGDPEREKDYRNYIDYNFEYNKANELICSQFIDKQIYGNTNLKIFINNNFKTNEEINLNKTLIPAYLALILSLGIAVFQTYFTNNSEIITIQNQLSELQKIIDDQTSNELKNIESSLQNIRNSTNESKTDKLLEEILLEIKEAKQEN